MTRTTSTRTTIDPQELAEAYEKCRAIAAEYGRTYYLATRLLPPDKRPGFHALYAFARVVDDLIDIEAGTTQTYEESAAEVDRVEAQLRILLADPYAIDQLDPVWRPNLIAWADTMHRYPIQPQHVWAFLRSMRMDLPGTPEFRTHYDTMDQLNAYMAGSAAAIGQQLLAIMGAVVPLEEAAPRAAALGEAFQLTNFIRDVGEDLTRGRLYLPAEELAVFGVDYELLQYCQANGKTDARVQRALAHFAAINRSIYRRALPGIDMLEPDVRPSMRTTYVLYSDILTEIEKADFKVLDRRAVVPTRRKLAVAGPEIVRSLVLQQRAKWRR